jgi:excisionase family DNA binding protein
MSIDPSPASEGELDVVAFVAFIDDGRAMLSRPTRFDFRKLSPADRAALARLAKVARRQPGEIWKVGAGMESRLPKVAASALAEIFERMASGGTFNLVPADRAVTTQEAADHLGMSRQYLVRLLDAKALPSHKVGSHRRVKFADLQAYAVSRDKRRRAAVDEMVKLSQRTGLQD